jgi:hypothetical protein
MKQLALASLAFAALLAGCGSPSDVEATTSATPTTAAPASEEPAVTAAPDALTVPDVVGQDSRDAERALKAAGLTTRLSSVRVMDVGSQEPAAGTEVAAGSAVELGLLEPPVVPHTVQQDGSAITAVVDQTITDRDAWLITQSISRTDLDEGGYFVLINCATGGTDTTDNRQANGKIAVGALGAAQTGLNQGGFDAELLDGATCP